MLNIINLPTIVDLRPKIALFDKNSSEVLMLLDYSELGMLKSVYKKFNHPINFKENFWLSDAQFKELSKIGYEEKLDQIGLKVDYNDTEIVLYNNVLNQIDRNYPIVLFEELVGNQQENIAILTKIKEKLENKGFTIFQTRSITANIEVGNATANLILEFLTGHKIKNDKFVLLDVTQFDNIFYYDNNANRSLYLRNINEILELRLQVSNPQIANNIRGYVNNSNIMLSINTVSTNEVNLISTLNIKVTAVSRHVKNFESYNPLSDSKTISNFSAFTKL